MMTDSSGTTRVIGAGDLLRSPLPVEAAALGAPATKGADLLSLGDPGIDRPAPAAGNRAPKVEIAQRQIAACLGAKTITFTARTSDPDGDPVSLRWLPGDGSEAAETATISRQYLAGRHTLTCIASDRRGGETAAVVQLDVPLPNQYGRSIGIDVTKYGRESRFSTFPGETAGAVPNRNWNQLHRTQGQTVFQKKFPWRDEYESGKVRWLDNTGATIPLRIEAKGWGSALSLGDVPTSLPNDRLMCGGVTMQSDQPFVVEGIPYKKYDVLVYLGGDAYKPAPETPLWKPLVVKREKPRSLGEPIVTLNGRGRIFENSGEHHRWGGYFREITEEDPDGNVMVFRNLNGSKLEVNVRGGIFCGLQVLELLR
jgi:hypothetical protein